MADSRSEIIEGHDSVQGGNNNNHQLESTLARMVDYFERQEGRMDRIDQTTSDIPDDVALKRFHKFRPLGLMEKVERKWLRNR